MIEGLVNANREAVVPLRIFGPASEMSVQMQAVVDTGFDDFLT